MDRAVKDRPSGAVIWITGLSGAGKSTLAVEVTRRLRAMGKTVVILDGDELREVFGAAATVGPTHDRVTRLSLAMQYAHLCRVIAEQGFTVVIATISLFKEVHAWNRENLPRYFEVFLNVPVEELRRRDPKGIYRRFDAGELTNVAGLDLVVDAPHTSDLVFDFDQTGSPSDYAIDLIERFLEQRK